VDFADFLETMKLVESGQCEDPADWAAFCHNDLVSANYLLCEGRSTSPHGVISGAPARERSIKILDWEFSGWGDIYYDLAAIDYTHDNEGPVPVVLEEIVLACAFGEVTDHHRKRLNGMKYMLMLFTGLWGLAQYGMQCAGLIPAVEGFDYLEFAEYLFAHDILELQHMCKV
jgi:thiamine kinase-like enzyme